MLKVIQEALTFDDVLLVPNHSNILPSDASLKTQLTSKVQLNIPLISAAMDTVTESNMAIAIGKLGGIGVIHRNLNIVDQTKEIKKVKKKNLLVGAAVGTNKDDLERLNLLGV